MIDFFFNDKYSTRLYMTDLNTAKYQADLNFPKKKKKAEKWTADKC